QVPIGQSILARTLLVPLEPGAVNLATLTELQSLTSQLPHAMAGYLEWLAPQMDDLPKLLAETFAGSRCRAQKEGNHLRVPEALAHLWLGLHAGLQFAEEIGAILHQQAEELRQECWAAFLELGSELTRAIEGERPTRRFLEVL